MGKPKTYEVPKTVQTAVQAKIEGGKHAHFLAGGTEILRLNSSVNQVATYISLAELGLSTIRAQGKSLVIGATVTLQELMDNPKVPDSLCQTMQDTLPRPIRNVATIGGNLAAKRRDSYLIPALLALQSTVQLVNLQGEKQEVNLLQYVERHMPGIIISVTIPDASRPVVVHRVAKTLRATPVCTVAASCDLRATSSASISSSANTKKHGATLNNVRLFVVGGKPQYVQLTQLEQLLHQGKTLTQKAIEQILQKELRHKSDLLGTKAYKEYITRVTVERVLTELAKLNGVAAPFVAQATPAQIGGIS